MKKNGKLPWSAQDAGVHSELIDESHRLRLHAGCLTILGAKSGAGRYKKRTVHQNIAVRPPVQPRPLCLRRVQTSRHL